jgi:hypothetical protein
VALVIAGATLFGIGLEAAANGPKPAPLKRWWLSLKAGLVVQRVCDVRVHIADLAASGDQHDDNNQSDQNQDKGVLDHTLPSLPRTSKAV